jgi:hypothetical protein
MILRWDTSHTLTKAEAEKIPESEHNYISSLDGKRFIHMQVPERYVNHSCKANTTAKNHCDVAVCDIKKGEEITANYSEEMIPGIEMECCCGNKNCRKIIKSNP